MANKLPWFTHDHNARNDEFIQRAEDKFGHFGYSAYFKILELIHEHGTGGIVTMTKGRLCQNLRSRWPQVEQYLNFSRTSGKVQFNLSGDEVQLQNKKFIERQRYLKSNAGSMQVQNAVKIHIDRDIERDRERDNDIGTLAPKAIPPTLDEVKAYFKEKGTDQDPERFFAYYESSGWMRGRAKIKNWKACLTTWEKNKHGNGVKDGSRNVGSAAYVPGKYDGIGQ